MGLKSDLVNAARQVGGAFKTVNDRVKIVERFEQKLKEDNIQIRSIHNLKSKFIERYVQSRIEDGISKRTIQNEMSALRQILIVSGHEKLANSERLSTKSLAIGDACRDGTKTAISDQKFQQLTNNLAKMDKGSELCANLQRYLGLRREEAIRSKDSLRTWAKQLANNQPLRIVKGTKGGRPRDVRVVDTEKAKEIVKIAIALAKLQNGNLIDKPDLKSAMDHYSYCMRESGAVDKNSSHSLRYRFASDRVEAYQKEGFTRREALAMTSLDLGHGDGRGAYISQVYLK